MTLYFDINPRESDYFISLEFFLFFGTLVESGDIIIDMTVYTSFSQILHYLVYMYMYGEGEVGMAVPKYTQTRFVGIAYHIHPYACFSQ